MSSFGMFFCNLSDICESNSVVALQDLLFLVLNIIIRFGMESGVSKETVVSGNLMVHALGGSGIEKGWSLLINLLELLPIFVVPILMVVLYIVTYRNSNWNCLNHFFTVGNFLSYMLMSMHWMLESSMIVASEELVNFGKIFAPRIIYSIGLILFVLLALSLSRNKKDIISASNPTETLASVATGMLSAWSSTILLLLGRQGSYVALVCILGGMILLL